MILGISWYNRRVCFALRSKKLREDSIILWAWISSYLPSFVRNAVAQWVHYVFDFVDFRWMSNVYIDTSMGQLPPSDGPALIAMSHPGLDERLLLQYVSRSRCGGRRAVAASNLIDPNTKAQYSEDFMRFMGLNGVLSRRLKALLEGRPTSETAGPGDANETFFESMVDVLARGDNVLFAPEGETNPWPSLKPYKSGVVRVAVRYVLRTGRSVALVPMACHFIATGQYTRDIIIRVGAHIHITPETLALYTETDCGTNDNGVDVNSEAIRGYVSRTTRQLRVAMGAVHDSVPYGIAETAPHHNGRSDLEKADAHLHRQLSFQDTVANLVSALLVLSKEGRVRGPIGRDVVTDVDARSKAIWRCTAIQMLCCYLRSHESAALLLGDPFLAFDAKLQELIAFLTSSVPDCPVVMQSLPVDFCSRYIPSILRCCCDAGGCVGGSNSNTEHRLIELYRELILIAEQLFRLNSVILTKELFPIQ